MVTDVTATLALQPFKENPPFLTLQVFGMLRGCVVASQVKKRTREATIHPLRISTCRKPVMCSGFNLSVDFNLSGVRDFVIFHFFYPSKFIQLQIQRPDGTAGSAGTSGNSMQKNSRNSLFLDGLEAITLCLNTHVLSHACAL